MTSTRTAKRPSRAAALDLAASVIIPTHNRAGSLRRVLDALSCQSQDMRLVEVIVVVDGSSDETPAMLTGERWPLRLRVIEQDQQGVAAARNNGALSASAPVLIFIDDDVIPDEDFVAQHVRLQQDEGPCVAVGRLAADGEQAAPGWWRWLEWQLDKQYGEMARGERPIDGRALYSGNFSVAREQFWKVGGFTDDARACEDTDLGLKLQLAGSAFRINLAAIGHHGGYHDFAAWKRMAYRDGRWDGEAAIRLRYPLAWSQVFEGFRARHPVVRVMASLLLGRKPLLTPAAALMRAGAALAGHARLRTFERRLYGAIYNLVYWQGVCDELGGYRMLRRYVKSPTRAAFA